MLLCFCVFLFVRTHEMMNLYMNKQLWYALVWLLHAHIHLTFELLYNFKINLLCIPGSPQLVQNLCSGFSSVLHFLQIRSTFAPQFGQKLWLGVNLSLQEVQVTMSIFSSTIFEPHFGQKLVLPSAPHCVLEHRIFSLSWKCSNAITTG
jgi:hypothetical protein